jgi:ketosteroid isomerase-like protein
MKTNLIFTLTLCFLFGCAKPQPAPMTLQDQEVAKKELTDAVNAIVQGLEKMDTEVLFQSYSNSPDFILFTTDGSMVNYQAAKNHHFGWFKSLSSLKVTTVASEFRFLSGNIAVCAWCSRFEMMLKAGGNAKMDFAITLIFEKIDNHWKVVYQQTSALPPA